MSDKEKTPMHMHLNNWRVVPRFLITLYGYMFYSVSTWFMALSEPTASQAAFVSCIVGAGAAWFGLYVNSTSNGNSNSS